MILRTLLSISLIFSLPVHSREIVIGVGDQNQKALFIENGKLVGTKASKYQCVLNNLGTGYKLRFLPQVRMMRLLERGEIAIALPLGKYDAWDEFAIFSKPVVEVPYYFYTKEAIDLSADLSDKTFVIMRASVAKDMLTERYTKYQEVTSWSQALTLVKLDRFDGAIIPGPIAEQLAPDMLSGLTPTYLESRPVALYVSKKAISNETLIKQLNASIDRCVN